MRRITVTGYYEEKLKPDKLILFMVHTWDNHIIFKITSSLSSSWLRRPNICGFGIKDVVRWSLDEEPVVNPRCSPPVAQRSFCWCFHDDLWIVWAAPTTFDLDRSESRAALGFVALRSDRNPPADASRRFDPIQIGKSHRISENSRHQLCGLWNKLVLQQ